MNGSTFGTDASDYSDDVVTIATPEGIELHLPLAGFGTRFLGALVDQLIQLVLLLCVSALVSLAAWAVGGDITTWLLAVIIVVAFLIQTGYHVLFEVLAGGRTPGKRLAGCRVVKADGSAIGLTSSLIRNLVRVVDSLLTYLVGTVAVLATPRNQRLGDLAAGTIVVREPKQSAMPDQVHADPALAAEGANWDLTAIGGEEVAIARSFLDRRADLDAASRERIGTELATRLAPTVVGAPPGLSAERFLEIIVAAKTMGR